MKVREILLNNLSLLLREERRVREKRLYELSELARAIAISMEGHPFSAENEEYLRRSCSAVFSFEDDAYDTVMYPNGTVQAEERVCEISRDAAAFALFLSEYISEKGLPTPPWYEKKGSVCVAYVSTPRTDRAYLTLASVRRDVSVLYVENASAAVQAILAGKADYALLPYMSSGNSVLQGTAKLIDRHELSLSCLVRLSEGEQELSFALLSNEVTPFLFSEDMCLMLLLTADSYAHLGRMLSALTVFGYRQTALSTTAEEYGRVRANVALGGDGNYLALWIYLSLYSVGFSLFGRYPVIEG